MRIPKEFSTRFQKKLLKRFGVYDKVMPQSSTPSREVPEYIEKPDYVSRQVPLAPKLPEIKNNIQITGMKESCHIASNILKKLDLFIKPGVTTDDIDELVHNFSIEADAYPSPLHYKGFPKSVCTSVNNVAVHGIPDLRPLQNGDIVNVDITVYYNGYHGDCSKTFLVGDVDDRGQQLVNVTEECLGQHALNQIELPKLPDQSLVMSLFNKNEECRLQTHYCTLDIKKAIKLCGPDVPFCNIGQVIYRHAKRNGLTVLPAFVGHGIGTYFHGPPEIFHTLNRYPGLMKPGMTFTIEPVLSHGNERTVMLEDGWTVVTEDGARTAQVEHTVLITEDGAEILTK